MEIVILVCVSGSLGAAFLGQQILERGKRDFDRNDAAQPDLEKYKMLIGSYLKPELNASVVSRLEEAQTIRPMATLSRMAFLTR